MIKHRNVAVPVICVLCLTVTFLTSKAICFSESECLTEIASCKIKSDVDVGVVSHEVLKINEDEIRSKEKNISLPKSEEKTDSQISEKWISTVSFAGMTNPTIMTDALNKDKIDVNNMKHLPVHRIGTEQDLEKFKLKYCVENLIKRGYDEVPSFEDTTSNFDEEFFKDHSLLIVHMTAYSGSLRFDVGNVDFAGDSVCIYIEQTNNPLIGTDDAVGWFVTVAIEDDSLRDCKSFDAVMGQENKQMN